MERYRRYTNRSETRRHIALEQHSALVRLIAEHDSDGAARLAYLHVITARDEAVCAISRRLDA
jgi:DNA-binding FadR family transcriptional regulator